MEVLIVLFVIVFLALPVIALIVALSVRGDRNALDVRIKTLAAQIARLQDELAELRSAATPEGEVSAPDAISDTIPEAIPEETAVETPPGPEPEAEPVALEGAAGETGEAAEAVPSGGPARPARPPVDLESAIGARWSVVIGGIAVALGAVFLVRYSIEAGLLGPGARIAAGALFSAALFAAGEWLRRRDVAFAIAAMPNADIPGILTGAGAVGAFATVYSAHAIYGFFGPGLAFLLLTAVGLASLLLSAIHGPKLAALGVIGAYATPLLVASDAPSPVALALHVLVVTASVMGIARLRDWLWLAFAGVAGGVAWAVLAAAIGGATTGLAGLFLTVGLALIFAATFGWEKADRPVPPQDRPVDRPAVAAFAALAFAFLAQAGANGLLPLVPAGLGAGLVAIASAGIWPALAPVAIAGAVIVLIAIAAVDLALLVQPGLNTWEQIRQGLVPPDIAGYLWITALLAVPASAGATWAAWRYGAGARKAAGWHAAAAATVAFFALVIDYLRVSPFETRPLFGAAGLALAFAFALLTERFGRLDADDNAAPAPAAFAVASVAALCFAIAVSLDAGWMPLAFALAALGIAYVYMWRPVAILPWLAVGSAIIGTGSLWASLPFDSVVIGTFPVFNRLILLTGLPAIAMIAGGEILQRRGRDWPGGIVTALGLAVLGLFVGLEIRHWLNDGTIVVDRLSLAEAAAQTLAALAFTAGLQRVGMASAAPVYRHASTVAGAIGALWIAFGLMIGKNPFFTGEAVGATPIVNLLMPAYLLTGLVAGLIALDSRALRPRWFTLGFAALAGLLLFAFVTLSVRQAFQGTDIAFYRSTSDGEFWTYSVAWLVSGGALLALGLWLGSLPVRAASGLLIALTISKVFLLDMSELSGVYRALSFIGLGLSLLVIGRFYQRILLRRVAAGRSAQGA